MTQLIVEDPDEGSLLIIRDKEGKCQKETFRNRLRSARRLDRHISQQLGKRTEAAQEAGRQAYKNLIKTAKSYRITPRKQRILSLVAQGSTNFQIAKILKYFSEYSQGSYEEHFRETGCEQSHRSCHIYC